MSKLLSSIFFCDRALGKTVAAALRHAGATVEIHADHFPPDSPDIEWLPIVSERSWIVLTKDNRISKNLVEIQAIAQSRAKVFILASGNITSQKMAEIFVNNLTRMENMALSNPAPFIAKIYKTGPVKLVKGHIQLIKFLR